MKKINEKILETTAEKYFDSITSHITSKKGGYQDMRKVSKKRYFKASGLVPRVKKAIDIAKSENKIALQSFLEDLLDEDITRKNSKDNYKKLKELIIATPYEVKNIICLSKNKFILFYIDTNDKNKIKPTREGEILAKVFDYKHFKKEIVEYLKELNIKVCPYCNSQYTMTIRKNNGEYKAKYQIDHFYPQSLYPYLAISFYNLIPSCSNCNHNKSDEDTLIKEIYHPYQDDVHYKISFNTNQGSDRKIIENLIESGYLKEDNIEIEVFGDGSDKFKNYCNFFHIKEIYEQHNDVVYEIYAKSVLYPSSRRDELKSLFKEEKLDLFLEEEIRRFILGNYTNEEDFHKRPLSKLTHDIAKDLGLI